MKSIITSGILAVSLAFAGNAAMAAAAQPHKAVIAAHVIRPQSVQHAPVYGAWSNSAWPDVNVGQAPVFGAARPAAHIAARGYCPGGALGADIGQFIQGMLSGDPGPYANLIRDAQRMHGSPGSYDFSSSTYDTSPAAASEAQAGSDAENRAIQQMNDTNALTASMAAAEQQNDAANAATLQTEINAGM